MADKRETLQSSFMSAMTLSQMGMKNVPKRYVLPPQHRPTISQDPQGSMAALPVIDLSSLENPSLRSQVVEKVRTACKRTGVFQVIHHGIQTSLMNDALDAAADFFDLPSETKMRYMSNDIREPVRYGTSLNHVKDKVQYWRDFIKLYSHPISTWIHLWPSDPPTYKAKMGNYTKAVHVLHEKLMELVFESLGLRPDYLHEDIGEGLQFMAVNCYPSCPEPNLALGLPQHSDYGSLTIILQNYQGLEIMDSNEKWQPVPLIEGALIVQLGDQMEVLSNGHYKSVVHRATLNSEKKRLSIASIHSLAIDRKVIPAPELVDEQHPLLYRGTSFKDFLQFLSENDITEGRYINKLKKDP